MAAVVMVAWVHIPIENRGSTYQPVSQEAKGPHSLPQSFALQNYSPAAVRDVTFNEDVIINSGKDFMPPYNVDNNHTEGKVEFEFDVESSTHTQPSFNGEHIETQDDGNMLTSPQSQPQTKYLLARDCKRRQVNRPPRLEDYQCDLVAYAFAAAAHIKNYEPTNYLEAISSPECDKWVVAMEEEVKVGIPGVESNRYKARYVVRGFDQREGIDFNEVFSPIVRHTSIKVLLSIVALQDLELEQLDIKTAFLYGHLEEEIYVEQPEGFKVPGNEYNVCRLKILLYGLKQSHRQWYKRFDSFMIGHGYDLCSYDNCKPVPTPLAPHFKLSSHECPKSEEDKEDMSHVPYSSAVGSLMYAMVCTCPDLAHIVSVVSRYMLNPGYVDSDYAGDLDARKSLSSYIFSHCGSAISWFSSLQAITSLSTTEAEYISSTKGVNEAIWLRRMVNEFGLRQEGAATTTMKSYGFWFKVEIAGIVRDTYMVSDAVTSNRQRIHQLDYASCRPDTNFSLPELSGYPCVLDNSESSVGSDVASTSNIADTCLGNRILDTCDTGPPSSYAHLGNCDHSCQHYGARFCLNTPTTEQSTSPTEKEATLVQKKETRTEPSKNSACKALFGKDETDDKPETIKKMKHDD
nr:retrovirus-related Pol polyprotein from transposon TNT 1-94 [Tanacetum cinerariifolium]